MSDLPTARHGSGGGHGQLLGSDLAGLGFRVWGLGLLHPFGFGVWGEWGSKFRDWGERFRSIRIWVVGGLGCQGRLLPTQIVVCSFLRFAVVFRIFTNSSIQLFQAVRIRCMTLFDRVESGFRICDSIRLAA